MIKTRYVVTSLIGTAVMAIGAVGVASAATSNTSSASHTTIGTSGIPRPVFKQQREDAVAQVLDTTTTNVQSYKKNKDLSQLISEAGLTEKTFREKVKSQITTDLE